MGSVFEVGWLVAIMAIKRSRPRRRVRVRPTTAKKGSTATSKQVAALRKQVAALKVGNATPFANAGGTVGRSVGGFFGNPTMGSSLGSWLGSGIGKIFGSGAYKMTSNSCWNTASQCPAMHSNSENVIVRHRDYLGDISSSTTFVNREFAINPGLSSTFPFLSAIAANFQEYDFRGLVFEFRSTSADALNSTNTALGTVAMAIQYRAGASTFTSKQQVLNEMWAADSKPSESFFMPVECAPAECPMDIQYVRTSALASGDDIKFYDLGRLSVSTVGSQAVAVIGELWATYEVALKKPVLTSAIGVDALSAYQIRVGVTSLLSLGSTPLTVINNNFLPLDINFNQIYFPVGISGKFYVSCFWYGPVTARVPPTSGLVNCSYVNVNGFNTQESGGTAASGSLFRGFTILIPDSNLQARIDFGAGTGTFGAGDTFEISVAQVDFDTQAT